MNRLSREKNLTCDGDRATLKTFQGGFQLTISLSGRSQDMGASPRIIMALYRSPKNPKLDDAIRAACHHVSDEWLSSRHKRAKEIAEELHSAFGTLYEYRKIAEEHNSKFLVRIELQRKQKIVLADHEKALERREATFRELLTAAEYGELIVEIIRKGPKKALKWKVELAKAAAASNQTASDNEMWQHAAVLRVNALASELAAIDAEIANHCRAYHNRVHLKERDWVEDLHERLSRPSAHEGPQLRQASPRNRPLR